MSNSHNLSLFDNLITTSDLSLQQVRELFARANRFRDGAVDSIMEGRLLGTLFVQPSTRTRVSFEAAMWRLGGKVTGFAELVSTRAGDCFEESFEDVVRVLGAMTDVLVLRHPLNGAAERAAELIDVPVVNGGDGTNEHPTQALADIWMMEEALVGLSERVVGLGGELNNRAYHSMVPLLAMLKVAKVMLLPPPNGTIDERLSTLLDQHGLAWELCETMTEFVNASDIIELVPMFLPNYNHAFSTQFEAEDATIPETHILNRDILEKTQRAIPILHPGPRTAELASDLDDLPNVLFFKQVTWGVYMRMAILSSLF